MQQKKQKQNKTKKHDGYERNTGTRGVPTKYMIAPLSINPPQAGLHSALYVDTANTWNKAMVNAEAFISPRRRKKHWWFTCFESLVYIM